MKQTDTIENQYLDICSEFIEKRFGKDPGINRYPESDRILGNLVSPEDGGNVCWFDTSDLSWVEADQNFTSWCIMANGSVYVANPEDATGDEDIHFQTRHPREAAELIHLFVQPSSRLISPISESHCLELSELAGLYALIPCGKGLRALDLTRLPTSMPPDFRKALGVSLTQKENSLINGEGCEAHQFAKRWPNFVGTLPDAEPLVRAGYILCKDQPAGNGLNLLAGDPRIAGPFIYVLLVPSRDDVSSFYLGEYLNYDIDAYEQLENAFSEANDLEMTCAMLANLSVRLPMDFTDQIKLAAQSNLLRQRVMQSAAELINCRVPYHNLQNQYQAASSALNRIVSGRLAPLNTRSDNH